MGVFFPVYPPEDLNKLEQQKRAQLKAAILQALQFDPDIKALIGDKLPEVRRLLKNKTQHVFDELVPRP